MYETTEITKEEKQKISPLAEVITIELAKSELHKAYIKTIVFECLSEFYSKK